MDIGDTVRKALQEMIVPELEQIRRDYGEIKTALGLTNKRLDDMNAHLVDQSRRIDETNKRIEKTDAKVDAVHRDLIRRIDETRAELKGEMGRLNQRVDEVIFSIGRLYEVIVRREEHDDLKEQVKKISRHVGL